MIMDKYTPQFSLSPIHLAITHVMANASDYYPDRADWQDVEQGQVCHEFADFVDTWNEQTVITCEKQETESMLIYRMTADGVPFSFYKNDRYTSLIFNGHSEIIQQATYDYFVQSLNKEFQDIESFV